jgi:hypothetical protein
MQWRTYSIGYVIARIWSGQFHSRTLFRQTLLVVLLGNDGRWVWRLAESLNDN